MDIRARTTGGPTISPAGVEQAILRAVAYGDVFDYPLTLDEVHHYLVCVPAGFDVVSNALGRLVQRGRLASCRGFVTLPRRESIVEIRRRRERMSIEMWDKGKRYGRAIGALPFVRLVAVTGTLAVNNIDHGADIDYLVATVPHRVWLARSMTLAFVRLGRLEGVTICPNYVISTDAFAQLDRTLFTAHELAQMIPLYGYSVYLDLVQANTWARALLPNAFQDLGSDQELELYRVLRAAKRGGELLLTGRLGDLWEERESKVKIRRLSQQAEAIGACKANFAPDRCKGHLDDHGPGIGSAYARRLADLGLEPLDWGEVQGSTRW